MQHSVYGDLRDHAASIVRRNLQTAYAERLAQIATAPATGTPSDAPALARYELENLAHEASIAPKNTSFSVMTRAHLQVLERDANSVK